MVEVEGAAHACGSMNLRVVMILSTVVAMVLKMKVVE